MQELFSSEIQNLDRGRVIIHFEMETVGRTIVNGKCIGKNLHKARKLQNGGHDKPLERETSISQRFDTSKPEKKSRKFWSRAI